MVNQPLIIQHNVQSPYIQPINSQPIQNNTVSNMPQNQLNTQGINNVAINQPSKQIIIQQPSNNSNQSANQSNHQVQKQQIADQQVITDRPNQVPLPSAPTQIQPPPRTNLLQQISMSIETCNFSNPIHKNNVRYLIENIQEAINGSSIK